MPCRRRSYCIDGQGHGQEGRGTERPPDETLGRPARVTCRGVQLEIGAFLKNDHRGHRELRVSKRRSRTGTCSRRRPGATTCPRSNRMGLKKTASLAQDRGVQIHPRPPSAATPASGGHKRREECTPGQERGHVPGAAPARLRVPVRMTGEGAVATPEPDETLGRPARVTCRGVQRVSARIPAAW